MATPTSDVYGAFLARILEDDWLREEDEDVVNADMFQILNMAIFDFRFPRISLTLGKSEETEEDVFINTLTNSEIQVLATAMKLHWLKRQINTAKLIKQQYATKDFAFSSQANHLAKLSELLTLTEKEMIRTFDTYNRSRDGKPYSFSSLAGGISE